MSDLGAFGGDPSRQRALIEDVKANEALRQRLFKPIPEAGDLAEIASKYGLEPSILHLVRRLVADTQDEAVNAFLERLVGAIAPGAPVLDVVRRWFLWTWRDSGIAAKLDGSVAYAPAAAIIGLVQESIARRVSPQDWRSARVALAKIADPAAGDFAFAEAILSMGWDLRQVPGAAEDVADAIGAGLMVEVRSEQGWTEELSQRLDAFSLEIRNRVAEELNIKSREQAQSLFPQFSARSEELFAANEEMDSLRSRRQEIYDLWSVARERWAAGARDALVACAETTDVTLLTD